MGFVEYVSWDCILKSVQKDWLLINCGSGVFLCIRCSGIHRGMGTHISKVKSVDLDVWTPEQMAVCYPPPLLLQTLIWMYDHC